MALAGRSESEVHLFKGDFVLGKPELHSLELLGVHRLGAGIGEREIHSLVVHVGQDFPVHALTPALVRFGHQTGDFPVQPLLALHADLGLIVAVGRDAP